MVGLGWDGGGHVCTHVGRWGGNDHIRIRVSGTVGRGRSYIRDDGVGTTTYTWGGVTAVVTFTCTCQG